MWGTLKDIEDDMAETKRLWEIMKDIIKKNTKITDEMLEVIYREKRDAIYNPTQALELGVIDEIV
jgi:ATP-dependent protease ClpP protease subunit